MKVLVVVVLLFTTSVLASPVLQQSLSVFSKTRPDGLGVVWSNCGKDEDIGKIDDVKLIPDPPEKGKNLIVDGLVTLDEKVTGGEIKLALKWGLLPLPGQTFNLCEVVRNGCPLEAGSIELNVNAEIPSSSPSGGYTANVVAKSNDNKQIACIDLEFRL